MEELLRAIRMTPIIDNHAHPLLLPAFQDKYDLLAITTEAHGDAMKATKSSLAHIRAVKQLSDVLGCPPTWDDVVAAIKVEKAKPHHVWEKRCLEGIEIILVDDGLDGKEEVYDYRWHDKLTRSECKKIVRIEKLAEQIIDELYKNDDLDLDEIFNGFSEAFDLAIKMAIDDPDIVGFKSVICYRTGLDIPPLLSERAVKEAFISRLDEMQDSGTSRFTRLDMEPVNAWLVDKAAAMLVKESDPVKPLQFHTGLGDSDITLTTSSPSHLQGFIRKFPKLPIVLLHASYPWTKEAGYLAAVYDNVYADIGEVFPMISKNGQENIVREILEFCPTQKILWSTDGHWFPETYLLAVIQVREAFEVVLTDYVNNGALTIPQAIRAVEDMFFNTSNDLYGLGLPLEPLNPPALSLAIGPTSTPPGLQFLDKFLTEYPKTKFLRLQYVDYTATPRIRIIPVKRARNIFQTNSTLSIGITKACLGLLQNDTTIPSVTATGEYRLHADLVSLRPGPSEGYAFVQGNFLETDGTPATLCPRTLLSRVLADAREQNLEFLIGFEIEIVFLSRNSDSNLALLEPGHAWSSARSLHGGQILAILNEIYDSLLSSGIDLEQFHAESALGQYEFVLPPLSPLEACDMVLHAREIISTIATKKGFRATLYPKPFMNMAGNASHVHISISSSNGGDKNVYESFYAGILKHLPSLLAFTYSNPASYDRMVDGCWAGGRWVAWGTQNRETALRKIEGSHWEIKVLDGLANVYLAIAAIIAAGSLGVAKKEILELMDCLKDPASLSAIEKKELGIEEMLPRDLDAALKELRRDDELIESIGKEVVDRYNAVKDAETKFLESMNTDERKEWIIDRY